MTFMVQSVETAVLGTICTGQEVPNEAALHEEVSVAGGIISQTLLATSREAEGASVAVAVLEAVVEDVVISWVTGVTVDVHLSNASTSTLVSTQEVKVLHLIRVKWVLSMQLLFTTAGGVQVKATQATANQQAVEVEPCGNGLRQTLDRTQPQELANLTRQNNHRQLVALQLQTWLGTILCRPHANVQIDALLNKPNSFIHFLHAKMKIAIEHLLMGPCAARGAFLFAFAFNSSQSFVFIAQLCVSFDFYIK